MTIKHYARIVVNASDDLYHRRGVNKSCWSPLKWVNVPQIMHLEP